jgi:hypothetical protein
MIAADTRSPTNALQTFRNSSGSLAIFAAIRRASLDQTRGRHRLPRHLLKKICTSACYAALIVGKSWGMRLIILIVSAAVVWLQAREISKLKADVADKSVQQSFDLKRQCAADADRYFKKWNGVQTPSSTAQVGYESHYNPRQKACFVLIQYSDPSREDLGLTIV